MKTFFSFTYLIIWFLYAKSHTDPCKIAYVTVGDNNAKYRIPVDYVFVGKQTQRCLLSIVTQQVVFISFFFFPLRLNVFIGPNQQRD